MTAVVSALILVFGGAAALPADNARKRHTVARRSSRVVALALSAGIAPPSARVEPAITFVRTQTGWTPVPGHSKSRARSIDDRRARHRSGRAGAGGAARARAAGRAQHRPGACRAGVSRGVDVYPRAAARARGQGGGARAARVRAGPRRRRGAGHAPREPPPQRGRHAAGLATGPGRQGPRRAHVMHMHAVLLHLERLKHEHTMHRSALAARSRRRSSDRRCFWARPRRPKVAPAAAPSRASCPTARPRKRRTT